MGTVVEKDEFSAEPPIVIKQSVKEILAYTAIDILCAGAGMGVPVICILLGLPLGRHIAKKYLERENTIKEAGREILRLSFKAAAVTLLLMAVIWGRAVFLLFDPNADIINFGHPMILFEPRASLIGWLVLMIIVSPVLQALMTVFAALSTLAADPISRDKKRNGRPSS